nr:MAG TPA_asm: hypothetical protein [Caudoviricetes sp.]
MRKPRNHAIPRFFLCSCVFVGFAYSAGRADFKPNLCESGA